MACTPGETGFATLAEVTSYAASLRAAAAAGTPLAGDLVARSLARALADDRAAEAAEDFETLRAFVVARAHLPPKHWPTVKHGLDRLRSVVGEPGAPRFDKMFSRVLDGGRWRQAAAYAAEKHERETNHRPWVLLVMGCNGVRKTTSCFQAWFKQALAFSLGRTYTGPREDLPDGNNAFFRQLDFMMANVCNLEFARMYNSACCSGSDDGRSNVDAYMQLKGAIFARYRGLCEMLGGLLLESAAQRGMNVMLETSGKDIASFHYVNYFFPSSHYRKLVVYFEINDVKHAEQSVDGRMKREMERGRDLVSRQATTVRDLMAVNCGGPYGGKQLCAVEAAARATWDKVTNPVLVGGRRLGKQGKRGERERRVVGVAVCADRDPRRFGPGGMVGGGCGCGGWWVGPPEHSSV